MATHRKPGDGSITQQASGAWKAQLYVQGQRLTHTLPTQRAALAWIREQRTRAEEGRLPPRAAKMTTRHLLDTWLSVKRNTVKPKTYQLYELTTRLHIAPRLGDIPLPDLRVDHLQALYDSLAKSPRTAQNCHLILSQALRFAVDSRLLPYNPALPAHPARYAKPEMQTWTAEQANAFLSSANDERWGAVYWVLLTCGLRAGELCGLRWGDVDMEGKRLTVRRTVQRIPQEGGLVVGDTKTGKARSIDLMDEVVARLRVWRTRQLGERLRAGEAWQDKDYLISTKTGTPLEPRRLARDFALRVERLRLPPIRLHDLRHTCGTLLLSRGVNVKVVQELLGHSSITITLGIYAHVLPTMQQTAVEAAEAIYRKQS